MLTRPLRLVIFAGLFLAPLSALLVTGQLFFPFITGKAFLFRVITEIIFALWIILAVYSPADRPKKSWLLWAAVVFGAVLTLATIFSQNPAKSFWSNFERMEGLVAHLHLLAYFIVLISVMKAEKLWGWLIHISLGVNALVSFYGLFQLMGWFGGELGGVRVAATFGNATYLAVYELFHIFFLVFLLLGRPRRSLAISYAALLALNLVIPYATATRGTILALIGGIFLFALLTASRNRGEPWLGKISLAGLALIVVLTASFWLGRDSDFVNNNYVLKRFATISASETSTLSRLTIWGMAARAFLEHPILGWGPENFDYVFNQYYDPVLYNQEPWFDRAHNAVFDWLIAGGIFGLAAYLALFIAALFYLWRPASRFSNLERALLSSLFAAYFFHNLFVFDNLVSYILFFSLLAFIHFRATSAVSGEPAESARAFTPAGGWAGLAWCLAVPTLVLGLYFFSFRPLVLANEMVAIRRLPIQSVSSGEHLSRFKALVTQDLLPTGEAIEQFLPIAQSIVRQDQLPEELRREYLVTAIWAAERYAAVEPQSARRQLLAGAHLGRLGNYDLAQRYLTSALELSPKRQVIYFELAQYYLAINQPEKAREMVDQARALEPANPDIEKYYALIDQLDSP